MGRRGEGTGGGRLRQEGHAPCTEPLLRTRNTPGGVLACTHKVSQAARGGMRSAFPSNRQPAYQRHSRHPPTTPFLHTWKQAQAHSYRHTRTSFCSAVGRSMGPWNQGWPTTPQRHGSAAAGGARDKRTGFGPGGPAGRGRWGRPRGGFSESHGDTAPTSLQRKPATDGYCGMMAKGGLEWWRKRAEKGAEEQGSMRWKNNGV